MALQARPLRISITIERYGHLEAEDARSPLERLLLSPYGTEDEVLVDEAELHRRYGVVRRWCAAVRPDRRAARHRRSFSATSSA